MSRGSSSTYTATTESLRSDISLVDFAVLGVLHERPMHGYDVARHFADDLDLGLVLPFELATVYGILKSLKGRRLIEGRRETVDRRPPRMDQITGPLHAQISASRGYLEALLRRRLQAEPGGFDELVFSSELGVAKATIAWLEQEIERGYSEFEDLPPCGE